MAYSENWFRHLTAGFTGEGLSQELARDFWPEEDLWDISQPIRFLWLKLLWVYVMSIVTQVIVFAILLGAAMEPFRPGAFVWATVGGIAIGTPIGIFASIVNYISLMSKK